ncbi:MAG TPA: ATP-grasp domain-containing protein, partial [Candidatus Limnocylindrales bacterium]|nr:ATP-grasp domain-containing protein [Candidatus Limnocylindrales bacterium]
MKIAIIYNRDSQAVINLFGKPNREKYGLQTIDQITEALVAGGHQVQAFEGDKNIISVLEEFMPAVISGERPGLVFNLSYGIQGRARYTHIPAILEMLGIPYVGSGPETHAVALDKVLTKMVLLQKGLPTPKFTVLEGPNFDFPLKDSLNFPLIVKPKGEALSLGLKIVYNEADLRAEVRHICEIFHGPALVEEFIEGREINIGLLGNDPVEALPPVELIFEKGTTIFTHEDKTNAGSRRIKKICPAQIGPEQTKYLSSLAVDAFKALGCFDSARVDFRLDKAGNPYILEVNSMASLNPGGSYVFAAEKVGLNYHTIVNQLIEIASRRYFGSFTQGKKSDDLPAEKQMQVFSHLTRNRDRIEEDLKKWTNMASWTGDLVALGAVVKQFEEQMQELNLERIPSLTSKRSAWTWQTKTGLEGGTLLICPVDIPKEGMGNYHIPFRREPEWLYGEGIASSRAGMVCLLHTLKALSDTGSLDQTPLGILIYADEGNGMRYSSQTVKQAAEKAGQVIVMQPGFQSGKIVDQRRGARKLSILLEGSIQRIGSSDGLGDIMSWFLKQAACLHSLSQPEERLTVAVQDIQSQHYNILLPHRIRATVYITYLDASLA